eukprot:2581789-Pyramimonas_sp.AAC.1
MKGVNSDTIGNLSAINGRSGVDTAPLSSPPRKLPESAGMARIGSCGRLALSPPPAGLLRQAPLLLQ